MNLQQGIESILDSNLENVRKALDAVIEGDKQDAVNKLESFINGVEAQRAKKIDDEQADRLIAKAHEIINHIHEPQVLSSS